MLVSICIPVFNGEKYIREAVVSALSQDGARVEILVQDNCSTDNTWEILTDLASNYSQVRPLRNETNIGMAPNWNRVISRAQGDYVLLLSADDFLENGFLMEVLSVFAKKNVDIVTTNHYVQKEGKREIRKINISEDEYRFFSAVVMLKNPFSINFTMFKSNVINNLIIKDVGLFRERYITCDYDLWLRTAISGFRVYYYDMPRGVYRIHGENLSRNIIKMNRQAALVLISHRDALKKAAPLAYKFTVCRFAARTIYNLIRYNKFDKRLFMALVSKIY